MSLRPTPGVLVLALLASACAVITGINEYAVDKGGASSSGSGGPSDGGVDANVVPTPKDGGKLPDSCTSGQVACESSFIAASCENGAWKRTSCPQTCNNNNGACDVYLSCRNAAGTDCGSTPLSCCATAPVPGGKFNRRNDATLPATVSAFELDMFEVTVGRFRAFVEAGGATQKQPPTAGSGAHSKLPGSGWHDEWNPRLPLDITVFTSDLKNGRSTWTDTAGANEHRPINNVDWLKAFAFCAWDGARLPTYAELNFAASGGSEQRLYPWSKSPTDNPLSGSPAVQAAFNCNFLSPVRSCPSSCTGCDPPDIAPVGSLPEGAGKWTHLDLAGNVTEYALDLSDPPEEASPPPDCNDCAVVLTTDPEKALIGTKTFTAQVYLLGGGYDSGDKELQTTAHDRRKYSERHDNQGFRCAREPRVVSP